MLAMRLRTIAVLIAFLLTNRCLTAQIVGRGRERAVIRGVVVDTLNRAVAGMRLYLFTDSIVPGLGEETRARVKWAVATAESDSQGQFAFEVRKLRMYTLRTFGPPLEAELDTSVMGASDAVTVRLLLGRPVTPNSVGATRSRLLAQLARAELRWAARDVSRYRVTAKLDCYCPSAKDGATKLEFRGDSLMGQVDDRGRLVSGPFRPWWKTFSVPSLFAAAEAEIRDPRRVVFSIVYDARYGFPSLISTDTNQRTTDLWMRYWIDEFRAVR